MPNDIITKSGMPKSDKEIVAEAIKNFPKFHQAQQEYCRRMNKTVKEYIFFKTTKPLTEGEIDPILQMCIDEKKKNDPNVEVFYTGLGCGGKTTRMNNAE